MPKMPHKGPLTVSPDRILDEQAFMRYLAKLVDTTLNPSEAGKPTIAFVLLTAKFGEVSGGRVNYVANCNRKDGQDLVVEFVNRIGRAGEKMGQHIDLRAEGDTENHGIEKVALMLENKRNLYVNTHGSFDHDTGMTEFSTAGEEYLSDLEELIEEVRALKTVQP